MAGPIYMSSYLSDTTLAMRHDASVAQLSLAWLLHRSPNMLPIPGTSSVAHLGENAGAAAVQLSNEEWTNIEQSAKSAKAAKA